MQVLPLGDLPIFSMLSHLELGFLPTEVLLGFLQNSLVLETLGSATIVARKFEQWRQYLHINFLFF
jgi:hypothetical protein